MLCPPPPRHLLAPPVEKEQLEVTYKKKCRKKKNIKRGSFIRQQKPTQLRGKRQGTIKEQA